MLPRVEMILVYLLDSQRRKIKGRDDSCALLFWLRVIIKIVFESAESHLSSLLVNKGFFASGVLGSRSSE
jgi:hypothetical protein